MVLLVVVALPTRSGAQATPTPTISLSDQSITVGAGGRFQLVVTARGVDTASSEIAVTVHQRVRSASRLEQSLDGAKLGGPESFDVKHLNQLDVVESPVGATATFTMQIGDPCAISVGGCVPLSEPGVYPVEVALRSRSTSRVLSSFVTYLVYVPFTSQPKLGVALFLPFHRDVTDRPGGTLSTLASPLATLVDRLAAHPGVPVTVLATPETLDRLDGPLDRPGADPDLIARLRTSLTGRQVVAGAYVDVDPRHLADARLLGEIRASAATGRRAASRVLGTETDGRTYVVPEGRAVPPAAALSALGVTRIVASDSTLAPVKPTSSRGPTVVTIDQPVSFDTGVLDRTVPNRLPLFVTDPLIERRLRRKSATVDANLTIHQVLAIMAYRRLATGGQGDRAVVVNVPTALITSSTLDTLFVALQDHLLLRPTSLDDAFRVSSAKSDAPGATRTWASPPVPQLDPDATLVNNARKRLEGYASIFPPDAIPFEVGELNSELLGGLAAEPLAIRRVRDVDRTLDKSFAKVFVGSHKSFRLTSQRAQIPLNFTNEFLSPISVVLRLRSEKLEIARADGPMTLAPGPTLNRYKVRSRTPGRSVLVVGLLTPRNAIPLSQVSYSVRSTAASWVGISLTIGALLVLTLWWGRHVVRTRTRKRHPARERATV